MTDNAPVTHDEEAPGKPTNPMKPIYAPILAALALLLSGCGSVLVKTQSRVDPIVEYIALAAPTSESEAIDGWREATVTGAGSWRVRFTGLWLDGDVLRAESFSIAGLWTSYEGAPFAWRVEP